VDYSSIQQSRLADLKGLARFIKITTEMESAAPWKRQAWNNNQITTIERPRTVREIHNLRDVEVKIITDDERLVDMWDDPYDNVDNVIIPSVYVTVTTIASTGSTAISSLHSKLERKRGPKFWMPEKMVQKDSLAASSIRGILGNGLGSILMVKWISLTLTTCTILMPMGNRRLQARAKDSTGRRSKY
jgi:hypothetical protein